MRRGLRHLLSQSSLLVMLGSFRLTLLRSGHPGTAIFIPSDSKETVCDSRVVRNPTALSHSVSALRFHRYMLIWEGLLNLRDGRGHQIFLPEFLPTTNDVF